MKSVAIFYYSLSGNSEAAARAVAAGLPSGCEGHLVRVVPTEPRWQLKLPFVPMWRTFFGTMLPTSRGDEVAVTTEPAEWPDSDGVVIGSSTWWNRPCLPVRSLLRSQRFRDYIKGKPLGLFASCRGFFRNNLHEVGRAVADAGGRVVARDRFTYTGGLIATFLAFFAFLRFGTAQKRWLGVDLPPYGFTPETLAKAKAFGAGFTTAVDGSPEANEMGLLKIVRWLFLALALFDLALGIAFTFFSGEAVALAAPASFAEPQFFQRCVGLFLFQYVFVQFLGFLDPRRWTTALTMTVLVRASFAVMYVVQLGLWGSPFALLHWLFLASAALDAATTVFVLWAMGRLDLAFLQGDSVVSPDAPLSKALRLILAVLGVSEFFIGLSWLFLPEFLCHLFGIGVTVDPFWTRATGVFLVNIGIIQGLGALDANKYRSAALTGGVFRALWPILYWVSTAEGVGNGLFRFSIMFFSFFDLVSCIVIFWLIRRLASASRAQASVSVPTASQARAVMHG